VIILNWYEGFVGLGKRSGTFVVLQKIVVDFSLVH